VRTTPDARIPLPLPLERFDEAALAGPPQPKTLLAIRRKLRLRRDQWMIVLTWRGGLDATCRRRLDSVAEPVGLVAAARSADHAPRGFIGNRSASESSTCGPA
jgi:hypothetical protein